MKEYPRIEEKSIVRVVGSPDTKGMVFSVSNIGDVHKYEVFVEGELKTFYDGQIEPDNKKPEYIWVDSDEMRSYLTACQINRPSAGNLYSLNSARIDFVPYQFRPALKLIKADEPRILIADSVGVGKTIEAGLIIKELQARNEVNNIMVICPKPLVADRKWESEMKRFDEEFVPLDSAQLHQILSDTHRDGVWPSRYGKVIVPYSILDSRTYNGGNRKKRTYSLSDLDPAPRFDLVIIDEAHHLRNGSMEKEKAFAYKCVHYFCEHAKAVVMLTATPLQTGDDDLYTLLNLLRPDVVIDKDSFYMMAEPNPYISRSSHLVRLAQGDWKNDTLEELSKVLTTQWGRNIIASNPVYNQICDVLSQDEISREERVQLITDIESLHSFNMMINRTRRKDIQDFCIRRTHTLESAFTQQQKALHDALLSFEVAALSQLHGDRGVMFMMSTIRRQAASCIFGLAPHIKDILSRRFIQMNDDPDFEIDESNYEHMDFYEFRLLANQILQMAENLPEDDPKFENVLEIIKEKQKEKNNKIILFSTFRHTLSYIRHKLRQRGFRVAQIDGSVDNEERIELRNRFELPKDNEDAIDIMLFTEVGSEGLDYQFCDLMINYDLPWNPMRIEQRIGRIDRRGQKSEVVNIYNVITSDTVDADIYYRCLARIGVFEGSIGECEEILGEIAGQIEKIALNTELTDEERRLKLEQIADNEVRKAQELNKLENEQKEFFGFDLSNYTVSKEIQEAESPFLSPASLRHLIEMYFSRRLGEGTYIIGETALKSLRLNATARAKLLEDCQKLKGERNSQRRKWELYLKGGNQHHPITFDPDAAEKNREAFFITTVHPLIKQAAAYFSGENVVNIHLEYFSDEIPEADYPMSIYAWNYTGVRSDFKLVAVCEEPKLEKELPNYVLNAESVNYPVNLKEDAWDLLEGLHVRKWMAEKEKHVQSTRQMASYRMETLRNNFENRRALLIRKADSSMDRRIETMYRGELENATEQYQMKMADIEDKVAKADIHTSLIANGVITVKRKG